MPPYQLKQDKIMTFFITCDYEAFGSSGRTFQVILLQAEDGTDYTFLINQNTPYLALRDVKSDLAAKLDVDCDEIDLEEI